MNTSPSHTRPNQKNHLIGEVLETAGLISDAQLQTALFDQQVYDDLKFGEILALRGWIDQETADFFAKYAKGELTILQSKRLGDYLREAHLLTKEQLLVVLDEQKINHMLFGSVAVLKGYINQKTLDFFLRNILNQVVNERQFWRPTHRERVPHPVGKSTKTQIATPSHSEITLVGQNTQADPTEINWLG
jgi:hypothetical protein